MENLTSHLREVYLTSTVSESHMRALKMETVRICEMSTIVPEYNLLGATTHKLSTHLQFFISLFSYLINVIEEMEE
jgi:hypothetical protein